MIAAEHERERAGLDERRERRLDPPVRALGVSGRDRQVAVVDDREGFEHVDVERGVVRAQQHRRGADALRTEPRTGPEAGRRVERDPDRRCIDSRQVGHVRQAHEGADARKTRIDARVDWSES
jgi:hypothetical protein